jgi:hypothetical protein
MMLYGLAAAGLVGLTLLAYVPFLDTGFAGTDSLPLVVTSRFTSIGEAAQLFARPVMAGTRFEQGEIIYRPFVSFTFGLDHLVWGLNPLGYHITNLGLHLLAAGGVWLLACRLGLRGWSSLAGAGLFALHPLVVASVPVIARRDSVLPVAAFTAGAALLLAADRAQGLRRGLLWLGSIVLIGVALLSKESAFAALLMLPVLLVCARLARAATTPRAMHTGSALLCEVRAALARPWLPLPMFALAGIVFVVRLAVLSGRLGGPADNAHLTVVDFDQYSQTLGAFTRLLAWPIAWIASSTRQIWPLLAAAALLFLALTLPWQPSRQATIALSGTLWVVAFAIFVVVLKIATVAWLAYFALVGVALVFAAGLEGAVVAIRTAQASLARLAAVLLLLGLSVYALVSMSASPLVRRYDQWHTAGDVIDRFAQALTQCVASTTRVTHVRLQAVPSTLDDGRVDSNLLGVTLIESYTVDAMLRVTYPGRDIGARIDSFETLRAGPQSLQFSCAALPPDGVDFVTGY